MRLGSKLTVVATGVVLAGAAVVVVTGSDNTATRPTSPTALRAAAAASQTKPAPLSKAAAAKSARAFANQPDRVAARTAVRTFGAVMRDPGWPDLHADPRVRVKKILRGGHQAIVTVDGKRAQVSSMLPLTLRDRHGGQQPVSTQLQSRGRALVAKNVLSDYHLNWSLGTTRASQPAVVFGRAGFSLSPGGGATARVVSGKAIWTNIHKDTDFIAAPLPSSVSAMWLLRSIDSPTHLRLRVGGAQIVRVARSGVAELLRGGRRVGTLTPPAAFDADGRSVPVSWKATGTSLVLDVRHRSGSFRRPILVDPYVADDQRYWLANAAMDFNGWQFSRNTTFVAAAAGTGAYGNGLNLGVSATSSGIPSGSYGRWDFRARAPLPSSPFFAEGAHIFKADFGYTAAAVSGLRAACWQEGIFRNDSFPELSGRWRNSQTTDSYNLYPLIQTNPERHLPFASCSDEGQPGNVATYGYRVHCLSPCDLYGGNPTLGTPGNTAGLTINPTASFSASAFVFMGASLIFQSEQYGPHNQLTGLPAGGAWVDDIPLTARADDYGLGTAAISASAPGTTWAGSIAPTPTCITSTPNPPQGGPIGSANQGDRKHPCPQAMTTSFRTGGTSPMPEGSYNVHVHSADILGNPADTDTPVKIDRTGPEIQVAGALSSASAAEAHQQASNVLDLDVTATDGSSAGGPIATRSGVATVSVSFDGSQIDSQTSDASCVDSCAVTIPTIEADADQLTEADHTIKITATDRTGHSTEKTWTVPIIRNNYFTAKLAAWRSTVEAKVDAVVPLVPLIGRMPALPDKYSSANAKACVADTPTMEACDAQIKAWGADVRAWFTTNVALLAQALDTLPDMPGYVYAEDDYARRYIAAAQQEFQLAKKLSVNPAQIVDVRLNLRTPVSLSALTTALGSLTGLQGPVSFRGVLSKDEQPIVADQESDSTELVATQAEEFYSTLLDDIDEDISDFTAMEADPDLDPDDQAAAAAERTQLQEVRATVVDRGPLVSNVGIRLPVLSVLVARLSGLLDVVSVDLPIIDPSTGDLLEPGTKQMTASEYIANRLPGDAPASGALLQSAGIYHRGQRCLDRGEFSHAPAVARRTVPIPGDFMPSQHRLDSYVVAGAERKAHTLRWMWAAPASLQWFCGAIENRRGFEEEVRVPQGVSPRWSTNWYKTPQGHLFRKTNLPGAVPDDLACGKPKIPIIGPKPTCDGLNPFQTQRYPDFSLVSVMGHSFRYGKWYYTKFRTNAGETSDPDSRLQYSATATTRPSSNGGEAEFCNLSKISGRPNAEPASCMFSRNIVCLSDNGSFRDETLKIRQNFRDDPERCDL